MTQDDSERIVDLETRMAFLERLVDELNLIVTRQQDQLDELGLKFKELMAQAAASSLERDTSKPPHY